MQIYEAELKVMTLLWDKGDLSASEVVQIMKDLTDWNKNTTYTVIKKLVAKGAIERIEPGFVCHAVVSREDIRLTETTKLIDKLFDGSKSTFFSTLLNDEKLSRKELDELKKMIDKLS